MSRDLILVALSLMTWGLGEGMFLFFQPLYLQELGADPVMIGGILGISGVAATIAHLPAGYLADRIGRRPMMIAAWILGALATWIMALSGTLPLFVVGSALYFMTSFVVSPMNSYITAARGHLSVGRALTLISAAYNLGAILGPLLGGWIGDRSGLRANFLYAAIIFIFSTLIILFIRPQPLDRHFQDKTSPGLRSLLNKPFLSFVLIIFIAMFSMYLPVPLSQNYLQNQRGINLPQIGQLLSARSVGVILLSLALGQLNPRLGFLLSQAGMALFTIFLWRGNSFPWYFVGYLLLGGYQTARSLATAQGRALVEASNMGLAYGMVETASGFVFLLAPPLAGYLYSQNPIRIYSIGFFLIAAATLIALLFLPSRTGGILSLKTTQQPDYDTTSPHD